MASPTEQGRPRRVMRCWACEALLALVGRDGRLIVEADAETLMVGGNPVIRCPCGASTTLPDDWEDDER